MCTTILHSSRRFFAKVQNHIFFVNTFKCASRCITISVINNRNKYSQLCTTYNKAIFLVIITYLFSPCCLGLSMTLCNSYGIIVTSLRCQLMRVFIIGQICLATSQANVVQTVRLSCKCLDYWQIVLLLFLFCGRSRYQLRNFLA